MEFDTFVRHKLPVVGIIGNDACWTQIAREQVPHFKSAVACDLDVKIFLILNEQTSLPKKFFWFSSFSPHYLQKIYLIIFLNFNSILIMKKRQKH